VFQSLLQTGSEIPGQVTPAIADILQAVGALAVYAVDSILMQRPRAWNYRRMSLAVQDITEPSAVLGSLSDDELQAAYDFVLERFALELLIGAHKNSEWAGGKLVIDANHGPFIFCKLPSTPLSSKCSDGALWCVADSTGAGETIRSWKRQRSRVFSGHSGRQLLCRQKTLETSDLRFPAHRP
jgi:hypothetical protein